MPNISECEVDPLSALLTFAWANEISWKDLDALGWFTHNIAAAMITAVPE